MFCIIYLVNRCLYCIIRDCPLASSLEFLPENKKFLIAIFLLMTEFLRFVNFSPSSVIY